jgi:probable HAF family extracellular repeat protein
MRTLGTVGGDHNSQATGINNRTQVVGNSGSMDSNEYMFDLTGFLWRDGAMQSLGRLRDQDDGIGAINDKGQIVGSRGGHATVWEDGTPRDLATTRAESSSANDINNRGQIVGSWWARRNPGRSRAALWENKKPALLPNLPGGKNSGASAINEHGQIVGWAETKGGSTHAVLWTQKP